MSNPTNDQNLWLTPKQVREKLKVSDSTLRRWANTDKVKFITPVSNHRLYDYNSLIGTINKTAQAASSKKDYCYCRVSSAKQSNDLVRQKDFMQQKFPTYTVVSDIGSGINWKRPNFRKLVAESINGKVGTIVVAHRDRLCRFGFELLEFTFETCNVKLVVLDNIKHSSESTELAEDLLSIIHIFNCRQMGKRRYSGKNRTLAGDSNQKENTSQENETSSEKKNKKTKKKEKSGKET